MNLNEKILYLYDFCLIVLDDQFIDIDAEGETGTYLGFIHLPEMIDISTYRLHNESRYKIEYTINQKTNLPEMIFENIPHHYKRFLTYEPNIKRLAIPLHYLEVSYRQIRICNRFVKTYRDDEYPEGVSYDR